MRGAYNFYQKIDATRYSAQGGLQLRKTMSLVNKKKWNEEVWFTETNNLEWAVLDQLKKTKPDLHLLNF